MFVAHCTVFVINYLFVYLYIYIYQALSVLGLLLAPALPQLPSLPWRLRIHQRLGSALSWRVFNSCNHTHECQALHGYIKHITLPCLFWNWSFRRSKSTVTILTWPVSYYLWLRDAKVIGWIGPMLYQPLAFQFALHLCSFGRTGWCISRCG